MRFQIPAPEKTSFGAQGMALSPDGRRLAFITFTADGRPMLWLRSLDSVAAQVLPGTEGAAYLPFWSPDSRFIGFFVQGKLKKVDASGGPPQTLCEIQGALVGGSWSADGTILFGSPASGLFKVSQAGGTPMPALMPDSSKGEIGLMRPWFLPDGKHFLYETRNLRPDKNGIYLATLDGKERRWLVNSRQAGAYAPPTANSEHGHLREGTLMAQPLDPRQFTFAGEPFPVAEQVGSYLALGYFAVSANGVLAYRSGVVGGEGQQLAWLDRTGKIRAIIGGAGGVYGSLALSPDGKRVAVDEVDQSGNRNVWMVDVIRNISTRFTFDQGTDMGPVWSRDSTRVAFSSDRGVSGIYNIYEKDFGGTVSESLLMASSTSQRPLDWSPDGERLLFSQLSSETGWDLWVLPAIGGQAGERKPTPYLNTRFNESQGQFRPSPASAQQSIAYSSDESSPGHYQIYVQSFPAGAGKFQISTSGGAQPRWWRDGKELFYIGADGRLMAVDVKTAPGFEVSAPRALFEARMCAGFIGSTYFRYDVSADGNRFLINQIAGSWDASAAAPITVVVNWTAVSKHYYKPHKPSRRPLRASSMPTIIPLPSSASALCSFSVLIW